MVPKLCRNVGRMHQSVHRWRTAVLFRRQTCPKADLWRLPEAERDPADSEARGQRVQRDGDGDQGPAEEGEKPGGGDTPGGAVVWRRTSTNLITSGSGGM